MAIAKFLTKHSQIMSFKKVQYQLLMAVSVMLFACNSDKTSTYKESASTPLPDTIAAQTSNIAPGPEAAADTAQFTYIGSDGIHLNPESYTYEYSEKPKKGKARQVTYAVSEVDRPPLFSDKCQGKKRPMECSNEALKSYFRKNIQYPTQAEPTKSEGLEFVTFTIEPDGSIGQNFSVVSKEKSCKSCAAAAVKAVASMPKWVPAMKDGKPVRVSLVLPVRFDYNN